MMRKNYVTPRTATINAQISILCSASVYANRYPGGDVYPDEPTMPLDDYLMVDGFNQLKWNLKKLAMMRKNYVTPRMTVVSAQITNLCSASAYAIKYTGGPEMPDQPEMPQDDYLMVD